ncbi:SymE family type I addiction module toxin [Flagellimonas sp. 389]|uniref:SymE family type I addiction module toxin n=1 Tax=Flagellimonas sp. 389 TaxID=2835862 RepID=UPI001BD2DF5F|nr:SymE family type I addiction module toxin [Flagellimonas sp. 389]MBS9463277.1 SymE family type I addiction module toxin [Flagellimonas sp. 389]
MAKKDNRSLKIHSYQRDNKQVPELRLIGVWMEQLGFNIGERVQITTRDRLLIIELLEEEAKEEVNYKAALQEVKQTLKKLSK